MTFLFWFGKSVLALGMWLWHRVEFDGLENIPKEGGYIACANHRTNMDPVYLAWKLPQQLYFMAKAELFRIPVLGYLVGKLGAFPVERGKGDKTALEYAEETVSNGRILGMFPEGSRSKDGKLQRGKSGVAVIAAHTGANVLPVGIEFEEPLRFRSKVTIHYGKMIPSTELKIENNSPADIKAATKRIMSEIAALIHQQI